MKTIISPVDFSDSSINAVSFAAELAKRATTHLTIVNILEEGEDEEKIKNKLKDLESDLRKSFGADLNCEWLIARGSLINGLKEVVKVQQPNLVVMGTNGASNLKQVLLGSNTVNVIANIKVPVLVIPEVARFENFLRKGKNRIVLATDLEELENENALDILKEIALVMVEPKVRVMNVRPKNTRLDPVSSYVRNILVSVFEPEIESERSTVFSSNVMSGINFYLNEHDDIGLVAMIARDSGKLIQKHYTREMATHTQFPLLVLCDDKI